jgi:predicted lipoprotein with Yx(FWY)xxD motif
VTLGLAAIALGAKTGSTVSAAHSSALGEEIVVDAHGDALYALSGETAHHLLCTSKECIKFWPPLTVGSRKARLKTGPGVKGKLGLIRRKHGVFQVTLRGLPLYRFFGDHSPGETNGQGIKSFGGTWSAATASKSARNRGAVGGQGVGALGGNGNGNGGGNNAPAPGGGNPSTSTSTTAMSTTTVTGSVTTTTTTYCYYPPC